MGVSGAASILHADLDAFYASVEQRNRPELRGKPIAVGGGVVLAASYEARAFGVHAAMPLNRARQMCPALIVVDGSYGEYAEISDTVFEICRRFTPLVEQISIDEAFLDVAGAKRLFGPADAIAARLRRDVKTETGLVVSVGAARTKFLAKVASRVAKPDGLVVVPPDGELPFLHALPVGHIWGVGPVTERKLADMGIHTVSQLATGDVRALERRLGRHAGRHLHALSWNRDPRPVVTHRGARSVGAQSAFGGNRHDPDFHRKVLARLADRVGSRLRKKGRSGRTIGVRIRFNDMQAITRATTLAAPVSSTEAIFQVAEHLTAQAVAEAAAGRGLTLLGVRVSSLAVAPHLQLELPLIGSGSAVTSAGSALSLARDRLDTAVDSLRSRFGKETLGPASALLERRGGVPDEFGDLAIPVEERRESGSELDAEDPARLEDRTGLDPHAEPERLG
jgi:DNA polymerase-4